ncbi:MAG TPA: hypothetical protein VFA24_03220 [Gaiellaceae bacterium]|nr:hypothetical protein [Gaiellaceae bacterium]
MADPIDDLRAVVASLPPAPAELEPLLAKTRERAYAVTDADLAAAKAAGSSEDAIFEQLVGAAIGEGLRRLDRAAEVIG